MAADVKRGWTMSSNEVRRATRTGVTITLSLLLVTVLSGTVFLLANGKRTVGVKHSGKSLLPVIETLKPFHKTLGKPKPGEWLAKYEENGQTFKQYLDYNPVRPTEKRKTIYILPIGKFSKKQRKIIDLTAEFMKTFYRLPVKTLKGIDDSTIPKSARRVHPEWGDKQFLSTYILNDVLVRRLPKDGVVVLGLTATDLWPGQGWNFVFGQAAIRRRVGVWSIYRNGDADGTQAEFNLCLLRTVKTAVHETGHMFSMLHCTAYECGMCGSNSRTESDARPLGFCPECMAKVCWLTDADPINRFEALAAFCKTHQLNDDFKFYDAQVNLLKKGKHEAAQK